MLKVGNTNIMGTDYVVWVPLFVYWLKEYHEAQAAKYCHMNVMVSVTHNSKKFSDELN